jgi:hypothetical protein
MGLPALLARRCPSGPLTGAVFFLIILRAGRSGQFQLPVWSEPFMTYELLFGVLAFAIACAAVSFVITVQSQKRNKS